MRLVLQERKNFISSYLFTRVSAYVVDLMFFSLKLFVQKHTRNIREAEDKAGVAPEQPGLPLFLMA